MRRALGSATFALMITLGCSPDDNSASTCSGAECLSQFYFESSLPDQASNCTETPPRALSGLSLPMALFWGAESSSAAAVRVVASRGARSLGRYGVSFQTSEPARAIAIDYAIDAPVSELEAALDEAHIPSNSELDQAERARASRVIGAHLFASLRDFAQNAARPDSVNLVALQHLISPELNEYLFGSRRPSLVGFAISPQLFAQANLDDPERDLWEMTGLDGCFAPMLFVASDDFHILGGNPDNIVAHELGHSLGLPHEQTPGNLMTPGQNRDCAEDLSAAQLAALRDTLTHGPCTLPTSTAAISTDTFTTASVSPAPSLTSGTSTHSTPWANSTTGWISSLVAAALEARRTRWRSRVLRGEASGR